MSTAGQIKTWADGPMAVFDVESTGTDVETDRIVTASVVTIEGATPRVRSWLANPGVDIPEGATAVHGITTAQAAAHGDDPRRVVVEIAHALIDAWSRGLPVVVYNAPFDLTMVDRELRRYGCNGLTVNGLVVDPLVLDKACDRYRRGSRKLVDTARHYGITLTAEDAHTSAGDCLAAARVAWKISRAYPTVGAMTPDKLMEFQAAARREQAASFEDYLRRKGTPEVISRAWPMTPFDTLGATA